MKRRRKYVVNSTVLLGLMSFLSYNACYAGRSVLSAIMPEMTQNSSFTNEVLGVWGSMFFLTYGLGQIINGIIGDRIKAKYMVFIGLFLSGFVIIASAWATSPSIGALCWGLCGFLLSMLWGPLSKLIAENTTQTTGRILMTSLSAASILGNMVAYLVASLASAKHEWKWALYITGILMIVTAAAWFVILHALEKKNKLHTIHRQSESFQTNKQLFHSLKQNAIIPMLAVAIINGIIRNAVAFWIPTYIAEKLHTPPATASAITSILPLINLAGTFWGLRLLKKCKDNDYKTSVFLFSISAVMFLTMWITDGASFIITVSALFLASAAMASSCNLVFSVYCQRFRDTGRVSMISGSLDAISYLFSAIASPIFSWIVTRSGWNVTVLLWTVLAAVGVLASIGGYRSDKRSHEKALVTDTLN